MSAQKVKATRGAKDNMNSHLVWCPKYRRQVLRGVVADRATQRLSESAEPWGFEMLAHEVMPDHVHLFVSAPPKDSPAALARLFKGAMSRSLRAEFPIVQSHIRKAGTLWSPSSYVGTAGHVSAAVRTRSILECQKR